MAAQVRGDFGGLFGRSRDDSMYIQNQQPGSQVERQQKFIHHILRVIVFALALLLVTLLIGSIDTAIANPIVIEPDNDTFEIHWPSGMMPPELVHLDCSDASGNSIYHNTITCDGSTCTGGERVRVGDARYLITDCKLMMTVNGRDLEVHYGPPLPIECRQTYQQEWVPIFEVDAAGKLTRTGGETRRVPDSEQCLWRIDLSNSTDLITVSSGSGRSLAIPGVQPAWARFLGGLLLAWLVEIPVLLVMTRVLFRPGVISLRRVIFLGLIMTLLTLPILWYVLPGLLSPKTYIPVGEALVVLVEAGILAIGLRIHFARALLMSLVANAASFGAGLLLL